MKTNYLFPVIFRKIGWIMFIPFFVLVIAYLSDCDLTFPSSKVFSLIPFGIMNNDDWGDELIVLGLTVSLIFIAFSRERDEDECIAEIRMHSLVWAIIVNYALLIVATFLIYDIAYLYFIDINIFTVLFLFIIKYNIALYKFRRINND